MKIGWLQSHQAHGYSVGQSTAAAAQPILTPDQRREIQRRDQTGAVAGILQAGLSAGRCSRRRSSHHQAAAALPLRHRPQVAQRASTTGSIWLEFSRVISKELTYGPGTRGTSASASRSQEKLFKNTLDASQSNAPSCHTSPITTSSWPLSLVPPVKTWYAN